MTVEELLEIGSKLPGTVSDIKWDHHVCLNVGEKMYLITSPDLVPINASFKVSDEEFETLITREGFRSAPYLGRYKWVEIDDISRLSHSEWVEILNNSHHLIASKLPVGKQKEIGIKPFHKI